MITKKIIIASVVGCLVIIGSIFWLFIRNNYGKSVSEQTQDILQNKMIGGRVVKVKNNKIEVETNKSGRRVVYGINFDDNTIIEKQEMKSMEKVENEPKNIPSEARIKYEYVRLSENNLMVGDFITAFSNDPIKENQEISAFKILIYGDPLLFF